jgi:hypothetical protein
MKRLLLVSLCCSLSTLALADEPAILGDPGCKVVGLAPPSVQERAVWKGPCKDGYADGDGVLDIARNDAPYGRFEGRLDRGQLVEAYFKGADGARYEGQFKNGRREGTGVAIEANGDRYDGAWKHGRRDGMGSQSFVLGGRYDGNWKDGRFDGKGSLTYAGGHQVNGMFMQGVLVDSPRPAARAAAEPEGAESFNLKAEAASLGSNIKRNAATGSSVPFDKGYAEMTPAQQAHVRAQYTLLEAGDEPPYPLKGTKQQFKWLNEASNRLEAPVGRLRVVAQVDAQGDVTQVAVYETPDPKFTPIITAMMLETKFKPAVCGGKPCAMAYPIYADMRRAMR